LCSVSIENISVSTESKLHEKFLLTITIKTPPMKNLQKGTIFLLLLLSPAFVFAQDNNLIQEPDNNKPTLFADVAAKFAVDINALETLLEVPVGQNVDAFLTRNFILKGVVVSKSDPSDLTVRSVVIRSSNRNGATMTFTKLRDENGAAIYIGRIVSYKNRDAFELNKEENGYVLVKKNLYDLISK
jgi:hypothetical protein